MLNDSGKIGIQHEVIGKLWIGSGATGEEWAHWQDLLDSYSTDARWHSLEEY